MKKITFILLSLLFLSFNIIAQNRVITAYNDTIFGKIESFLGKNLVFSTPIEQIDGKTIEISKVKEIAGEMPNSRKKAILRKNPNVEFYAVQSFNQAKNYGLEYKVPKTPGDLIQESSIMRLTAYGLSITSSTLIFANVFEDPETDKTIALISGIAGFGLYIASEVTLIKAGKLMNEQSVTLSPAEKGIGLAINF